MSCQFQFKTYLRCCPAAWTLWTAAAWLLGGVVGDLIKLEPEMPFFTVFCRLVQRGSGEDGMSG